LTQWSLNPRLLHLQAAPTGYRFAHSEAAYRAALRSLRRYRSLSSLHYEPPNQAALRSARFARYKKKYQKVNDRCKPNSEIVANLTLIRPDIGPYWSDRTIDRETTTETRRGMYVCVDLRINNPGVMLTTAPLPSLATTRP
jgi:hypothetical protein